MNGRAHPPAPTRAILIAGPTAVGKSEIALHLAERLRGEIISVDSMQVYRGMDIGTAKPTTAERARIRHHLIDVVGVDEPFDVAKFVTAAQAAQADILQRGRTPILCGGTGLYFKALLEGIGAAPPADAGLRAELEAAPLEQLLAELAGRDPESYAKIDRQNPRRVIRAVEVVRLTCRPYSAQRAAWSQPAGTPVWQPGYFGFTRRPEELRTRIDTRVAAMFRKDLVSETKTLLAQGLEKNPTALQAIGYRQVVEHLRGERSLAETIELVKIRTRQFAKRQLTWLRKYAPLQWIELQPDSDPAQMADRLAREGAGLQ